MLPFIRPTARCEPITCSSVVSLLKLVPTSVPSSSSCCVAPDGNRGAKRLERAGQPLGAGAKRQRMAARRQLQRAPFDDRNAVLGVVVAVAARPTCALSPVHAAPTFVKRAARMRVDHLRRAACSKSSDRRPPPPMFDGELSVAELDVVRRRRLPQPPCRHRTSLRRTRPGPAASEFRW